MRRYLALMITALLFLGACAEGTAGDREADGMNNPVVTIEMDGGGVMKIELYPDKAPNTAANFINLVQRGFYDGLIFHRVVPGFVIQGGCPLGVGNGNPGWSIKGEFTANGVDNRLSHAEGVLSMARSSAFDSAGSQFFITVANAAGLDGQYAVFGRVLEGMGYVKEIEAAPTKAERPVTDQAMVSIRVETFGKEYPFGKL